MFKKLVQFATLAVAAVAAKGEETDHWAVIVVGSNTYMNYRHHADGCHAYKQAINNGVPADQVILMAFDDVANAKENPFPGQLFNKPTPKGVKGVDVYEGCKIDYRFKEVNKETVLGVLMGNTTVGDKVLKSTEKSNVFFYYVDHGAPGLIGLPKAKPTEKQKNIKANELMNAIEYMHENKMYKQMTIYMEACESGSMFKKLKDDINVYAVSAANAKESSWGTYCHPHDKVEGRSMGTCLGDLFSVNWMEDLDAAVEKGYLATETLQAQYETIKKKTNKSHSLQWGDTGIATQDICEFEANQCETPKQDIWTTLKTFGKDLVKKEVGWEEADNAKKNDFAVDVRDIKLHYLYAKVLEENSVENQQALMDELTHRLTVDLRFERLFPDVIDKVKAKDYPLPDTDEDFDCYENLIDIYTDTCEEPDTYTTKYYGAFLHQCMAIKYYPTALDDFKQNLANECQTTA